MEDVRKWISDSGLGSGSGEGYGYGLGSGYGSGYGSGDGSGSGDGYGSGDGSGSGDGYGYGDGYSEGYGIGEFNNEKVYLIDDVPTIIKRIKGYIAKGYILNNDFSLTSCCVAKGGGYFAHGETVSDAIVALRMKIFENLDSDEAIDEFMKNFRKGKKYSGHEFYEWHHYLTGSCEMGRNAFVKNHDINLNDMLTVDEFIALCINDYGGEIIEKLKERWNMGENE